jgi:hypothetical protein
MSVVCPEYLRQLGKHLEDRVRRDEREGLGLGAESIEDPGAMRLAVNALSSSLLLLLLLLDCWFT